MSLLADELKSAHRSVEDPEPENQQAARRAAGNARSMDFNDPEAPFDPSSLKRSESRFLQMDRAVKRHYIATLGGLWGPSSRKALQRYIKHDLEEDNAPTNSDVMLLIVSTVVEFRRLDWAKSNFAGVDPDLLAPKLELIEGSETDVRAKFRMGDMLVETIVQSPSEMRDADFYGDGDVDVIYSARKSRMWASVLDVEDHLFLASRKTLRASSRLHLSARLHDSWKLIPT